jgi:hypothetical protein
VIEWVTGPIQKEVSQIALCTIRPIQSLAIQIFINNNTFEIGIQIISLKTLRTFIFIRVSITTSNRVGEDTVILMLEKIRIDITSRTLFGSQWGIYITIFDGWVFETLIIR